MEIRVLGPVGLSRQGLDIPVTGPKLRTLLALLALRANEPVPATRLVRMMWGLDAPATAPRLLHHHISSLRRLLGESDTLIAGPAGYLLRVPAGCLDLEVFRVLTATAAAAGSPAVAADGLREALLLWRGPALGGVSDELLAAEGPALAELRLSALADRFDAELALGRHIELLGELKQQVGQEPRHERFRGQLMTALHRSDRRAEALEVYERGRRLLSHELGIDPSAAIQALHRELLMDGRGATPPEPVAMAHIRPRQLPPDVSGFAGRAADLAFLDELREPGPVIICGMAGIGKTALAVHWAHRVADRFPDGQLYLNLHGYGPGSPLSTLDAVVRLLTGLGVPAGRIPSDEEQAAALLRSVMAGQRLLLIIDNARSPDQVRPLLPTGPASRTLVTSRNRLVGLVASDGAHRVHLDGLDPAGAVALIGAIVGTDQAGRDPAATHALAEACAMLPLALRIAAAQLRHVDNAIGELAARMTGGERLDLLKTHDDPHTAVEAAFQTSYAGLPADSQRTFRLVGLLPIPTFSAEVVGELTGAGPVDAAVALERLIDRHLVGRTANDHYAMHDLLRDFARQSAHRHDPEPLRATSLRRVFDYYLARAEGAALALYPQVARLPLVALPFTTPALASRWLADELANLIAIITEAREHGAGEVAWLATAALRGYFLAGSGTVGWRVSAQAALTAAEAESDLRGQAAARLSIANLHDHAGEYEQAIVQHGIALRLAERAGWPEAQASILNSLSTCHSRLGDIAGATGLAEQALEVNRRIGNKSSIAIVLNNLGILNTVGDHLALAEEQLHEALSIHQGAGTRRGAAVALINIGVLHRNRGEFGPAREYLAQACQIFEELGNQEGLAVALANLGAAEAQDGEAGAGLRTVRRALALIGRNRLVHAETLILNELGVVRRHLGDHALAAVYYHRSLRLSRPAGPRQQEIIALLGLAEVSTAQGHPAEVERYARWALAASQSAGYGFYAAWAERILSRVTL